MDICYGETFYKTKSLSEWAHKYLEVLPLDVTHLISRGASGCSIASAMLVLSERPLYHLFIRKGERAHSNDTTGFKPRSTTVCAIVDDFISLGGTVEDLLKWDAAQHRNIKYIIVSRCDSSSATKNILENHALQTNVDVKLLALDEREIERKERHTELTKTIKSVLEEREVK